jgi:uncharacterized protein YwqG
MKDSSFEKRRQESAQDFKIGVLPAMKKRGMTVYLIEELPWHGLVKALDCAGIDAFIVDKKQEIYGLSSRVNSKWFKSEPSFSFRYVREDRQTSRAYESEYHRLLRRVNEPENPLYPQFHIESFSKRAGSGQISWAVMAPTKKILNYIAANLIIDGKHIKGMNGVKAQKPTTNESRLVVSVSAEVLKRVCAVREIIV